ncbi:MAG: thioredoxin [Armatimonadota bacterium]|nr:thioredoxin [Armatimonadota bacterium]
MATITDTHLVVTCPRCGQKNRVPSHPGTVQPVCGRCGAELTAPHAVAGPVTVTDATFEAEVTRSPIPVLLDIWAPWCGPCRMVAPILDQIAVELAGKLKVAKLNADENPVTVRRMGVRGIPAMKLIRDGRVVDEMVGAAPKEHLMRWLQPHLSG